MTFHKTIYYCLECKKTVDSLHDLLFVEDQSDHGFCSETCIEDFFNPLILHFDNLEKKSRERLNILSEKISVNLEDKDLIEDILKKPSEVYKLSNEVNQNFYRFFKKYNSFTAIVTSLIFNNEPSFIFQLIKTAHDDFIQELRFGERIQIEPESINPIAKVGVDEADFIFENLESKKSKLLADLLINREQSDIAIESFSHYDYCLQDTLNFPDEIIEVKDEEGDTLNVFIKSFSDDSGNFFYIIYSLKDDDVADNNLPIPFFSFPTRDLNFYKSLRNGHRIQSQLKN